jgi:sugar phosphate isomerase/epimerase
MAVDLACSTLAFTRYDLEEALRRMADLGFAHAEVAITPGNPHLTPETVCRHLNDVVELLRSVSGIAPAALLVELESTELRLWQQQFPVLCRLANILGIVTVTIAAAPNGSDWAKEVERLRQVVSWAFPYGVVVCVETRLGTLTETPQAAVELCRCVPPLRLTLDPSHYLCGPNAGQSFDGVFPYVHHVHLRDSGTSPDKIQVRVGQGKMPFSRIIQQLRRYEYDRLITIEMFDKPEPPYALEPELRTLRLLLAGML